MSSLQAIRIIPTTEELNILREKLNSINDIKYEIPENKILNSRNINNKLSSPIKESIGILVGNSLKEKNIEDLKNKSKEEIINQYKNTINDLKNIISNNAYKIDNYDNILCENNELKNELSLINKNYNNEISENYLMNS